MLKHLKVRIHSQNIQPLPKKTPAQEQKEERRHQTVQQFQPTKKE